ncbi:MAG: tetratricopeptide repeat protein, partial [Deltaproteobacteria bacterium]|nr:tetratricopeptide repeat protein [Deltaproteobacteria bacterium]
MRVRSNFSWCYCSILFILPILIFGTLSCGTTSNLSVEDAKKILVFGEHGLKPPPRAGVDTNMARPLFLNAFDAVCRSEPPKSIDIATIIKNIKVHCRSGADGGRGVYCLADKLFARGRDAMYSGEYTDAIALIKAAIGKAKGKQDERYRSHLGMSYAVIGNFKAARRFIGGGNASLFQSKSGTYQVRVNSQVGRAAIERLKGNYRKAEVYYRKAQKLCKRGLNDLGHYVFYDTETQFMPDLGEVILMQGRLTEAQLVLRESFYRFPPRWSGRNTQLRSLVMLGRVFYQQGRNADAELITRAAIGGYRLYGECSLLDMNIAYQDLARIFLAQGQSEEALQQYETIRRNMRHTPRIFNMRFANDPDWAHALLTVGEFSRAETMLASALKTARGQYGDSHYRTAEIRGLLAVAQYRQSKTKAAGKNFTTALPILLEYTRVSSAQTDARIAFSRRLGRIVEGYLAFVFQLQGNSETAAKTTFPLADVLRGQSVQQAVRASSTRIAARDPRLADLVRREQDADKKITALNAVLLNARTQTEGGGKNTDALEKEIKQLVQARAIILDEIEAKFPAYAELTRPRPKTLDAVKAALQPDEALLAYYLGRNKAFVWSVNGKGTPGFTIIPMDVQAINRNVKAVRHSLQ